MILSGDLSVERTLTAHRTAGSYILTPRPLLLSALTLSLPQKASHTSKLPSGNTAA